MKIPILSYHSISNENCPLSLNLTEFEKQLFFFKKNKFESVFFDEIKNLSSNQLNDFITIMNAQNIILSDSTFAFWALLAGHNPNKKYFIGKKNLYLIDAFMKHVVIKVF